MKAIQISIAVVFIFLIFVCSSYGLGIRHYEMISIGMTYSEVVAAFGETGEFDYVIDAKTGRILGDVVMKWGGGLTHGVAGLNRTQLGYIVIRFTGITDNNPESGSVAAFGCCGLSNDPRCLCEKGDEEIYKDQILINTEGITTKRVKVRPGK